MNEGARLVVDGNLVGTTIDVIADAKERVWVSMFIVDSRFKTDQLYQVRAIVASLSAAVRRGVDVRVLVGASRVLEIRASNLAAGRVLTMAGVQTRVYPAAIDTHAKYLLVDDSVSLLGSHNWTPLSFNRSTEDSVLVRSVAIATGLANDFSAAWDMASKFEPVVPDLPDFTGAQRPTSARGDEFTKDDRPVTCELLLNRAYGPSVGGLLKSAVDSLDVAMFLMSGSKAANGPKSLIAGVMAAADRGCAVRVLLDQDAPGEAYHSGVVNRPTARRLLDAGAQVRLDARQRLAHSKLVIIDTKTTVLGSHNWTAPSLAAYHEVSLVLESASFAKSASQRYESLWKLAEPYIPTKPIRRG